jgi:molecular chaperone GrpE
MTDKARTPDPGSDEEDELDSDFDAGDGPEVGRGSAAAEDLALVMESQRAGIEAALNEQRDKYLRLGAEFDNFRKRAVRDREHAEQHGQRTVVRGLLEALDDLARFAHVDPSNTDVETMVNGAAMVEQKLLKSLAGHGLEVVNPLGAPFDPSVHEAVSTTAAKSEADDHTVAQVYQVGYVFNGQLLRPARVVVQQWAG